MLFFNNTNDNIFDCKRIISNDYFTTIYINLHKNMIKIFCCNSFSTDCLCNIIFLEISTYKNLLYNFDLIFYEK